MFTILQKHLLLLATLLYSPLVCSGQKVSIIEEQLISHYSPDATLLNGKLYQNLYYRDKGHPFLFNADAYDGDVTINDMEYHHQKISYNIYEQSVVVYIADGDSRKVFIPPSDYVSAFTINNSTFNKIDLLGKGALFYEVIYEGDIACYYYWSKTRDISDHRSDIQAYRFSEDERVSYLMINGIAERYKFTRSFVKLFPKEYRKSISKYIRAHDINVHKAPNSEVADIIDFCNSLLQNPPLPLPQNNSNNE